MTTATTTPLGSTIGNVGGGQLGRMLAGEASLMGYRPNMFAPESDSPPSVLFTARNCLREKQCSSSAHRASQQHRSQGWQPRRIWLAHSLHTCTKPCTV